MFTNPCLAIRWAVGDGNEAFLTVETLDGTVLFARLTVCFAVWPFTVENESMNASANIVLFFIVCVVCYGFSELSDIRAIVAAKIQKNTLFAS